MSQHVGIFGLGLIGTVLAERLLAGGYAVSGFDVAPSRGAALEDLGGTNADPQALWQCGILLSAVFSTDQLAEIIASAPTDTGKTLVSMSTCDPDEIADLAGYAAQKSITLVEAPISGSSGQLQKGDALLLLAGEPSGLDQFEQIADAISTKRERVGAIGAGNKTKLALNCILGLNRAALAEGLIFAKAMGLDQQTFLNTAKRSAAASDVMGAKGAKMVARDFAPLGRIAQSQKDFKLIAEMGERAGHGGLPLVARYLDLMENAIAAGEGDIDNAGVYLAVERMAKSNV